MKANRFAIALIAVIACVGTPSIVRGQATTVQLPTFRQFTVSTTVSAPDSGGAFLGGVRSSRQGSLSRGLPFASKLPGLSRLGKNRAIGREDSASGLSVHPTIIDFKELEDELLASASSTSRLAFDTARHAAELEATRLSSHVGSSESVASRIEEPIRPSASFVRSTPPSVADIARRNAFAKAAKNGEAYQWFERGLKAEKAGKKSAAKIFYQMAGRRGDAKLQAAVMKKIQSLQPAAQQ